MLDLIVEIGNSLFWNIVQLIIGCMISMGINLFAGDRLRAYRSNTVKDLSMIAVCSLIGMILPINTYGLIVPAVSLILLGGRLYFVLPLIISNLLFNMSVPYNDVSFAWRTGVLRIIFAFIAALLAGVILSRVKYDHESIMGISSLASVGKKPAGIMDAVKIVSDIVGKFGFYLVVGVIADTIFHKYIWWMILDTLFDNPNTSAIPRYFSRLNVVNPFFLLAINIAFLFMDFVKTSALSIILRVKGFIAYYAYFAVWAVLLATSALL